MLENEAWRFDGQGKTFFASKMPESGVLPPSRISIWKLPGEMARTFNCGVGMAAVVAADRADGVIGSLEDAGETAFRIGEIVAGQRGCTVAGSAETWSRLVRHARCLKHSGEEGRHPHFGPRLEHDGARRAGRWSV